jgi:hypothetical protein
VVKATTTISIENQTAVFFMTDPPFLSKADLVSLWLKTNRPNLSKRRQTMDAPRRPLFQKKDAPVG